MQNIRELRLRVESLSVYRLLIAESPDMVCVLSPNTEARVTFANEAFTRLIDLAPASITGRCFWEIVHPEVGRVWGLGRVRSTLFKFVEFES